MPNDKLFSFCSLANFFSVSLSNPDQKAMCRAERFSRFWSSSIPLFVNPVPPICNSSSWRNLLKVARALSVRGELPIQLTQRYFRWPRFAKCLIPASVNLYGRRKSSMLGIFAKWAIVAFVRRLTCVAFSHLSWDMAVRYAMPRSVILSNQQIQSRSNERLFESRRNPSSVTLWVSSHSTFSEGIAAR